MGITVQNITATSATVTWPASPSCVDSFYSIIYHPNWNSVLTGYSIKNFLKEDKIPMGQTSASLGNLSPQTTYILCVTCQSVNPHRDQCQLFNTLGQDSSALGSGRKELAMGIWLASSILLLLIAGILLYGCLHIWCRKRQEHPPEGSGAETGLPQSLHKAENASRLYSTSRNGEDSQLATIIENPFTSAETTSVSDQDTEQVPLESQDQEILTQIP
ncbi:fibronectin type III domain-containing protein 9 [Amia ocellicauda]|uniref:fibronectin type III domain-containing protein 9 n=1 Tax=Amia ocellicauda TaxID=2972642 RepID=UPI003464B5C2|nr:FNDC9 protein [Amia calva]